MYKNQLTFFCGNQSTFRVAKVISRTSYHVLQYSIDNGSGY